MALIFVIPIIISILYLINRFIAFEDTNIVTPLNDSKNADQQTVIDRRMKNIPFYIIGLILHQGTILKFNVPNYYFKNLINETVLQRDIVQQKK